MSQTVINHVFETNQYYTLIINHPHFLWCARLIGERLGNRRLMVAVFLFCNSLQDQKHFNRHLARMDAMGIVCETILLAYYSNSWC